MKLRDRAKRTLFREDYQRLGNAVGQLEQLIDQRGWIKDEERDVVEAIQQSTPSLHWGRDILLSGGPEVTEEERLQAVAEARRLYRRTVIGGRLVGLWTDFGFGQNVEITPRSPEAQEVWAEFWEARRNLPILKARDIHRLSDRVLTDGELFFILFADEATGLTTVRTRPTEEWKELVTDPDDDGIIMFYKREWESENAQQNTVYYRDWMFDPKAVETTSLGDQEGLPDNYPADDDQASAKVEGSDVTVLHAARDADDNKRGWPMPYRGARWIRAYRKLSMDLLSVTERNALYGSHITTKGGSRAVDVLKDTLQSAMTAITSDSETNPPPPAGSDLVTNEAVSMRDPTLNRAASEGNNVTSIIMGQAALAGGVFPHWLGRGEAFRLATATSMEEPVRRQFARYQAWWADVWRELCHAVLYNAQVYGGAVYYEETEEGQRVPVDALSVDIDISTDAILDQDIEAFSGAFVNLAPYIPDRETLTRLALQALNVPDIQDILDVAYPKDEVGSEEARIRKIDLGVIMATLRHLAEDDPTDTERRIVAAQALSIAEGSNGHNDRHLVEASRGVDRD